MSKRVGRAKRTRIPLSGRRFMILAAAVPTTCFYLLWVFLPIIYTLTVSLCATGPSSATLRFVGTGNYREAVLGDFLLGRVLLNTLYYTFASVPIRAALGLLIALMINSLPRWRGAFRTAYFLPVVTSVIATSILWKWLYQARFGFINQVIRLVLDTLGITSAETSIQWLGAKNLAMPSIIAMSVWKEVGFVVVIFLAGLTTIPQVYYEAARIDGAGRWHLFRHVTLPLLQPVMNFVLITGVIGDMQVFASPLIMTQGGPVNRTRTMVLYLYEKAFLLSRFGYASTLAVILFIILLVFTFIQLRFLRTRWEY